MSLSMVEVSCIVLYCIVLYIVYFTTHWYLCTVKPVHSGHRRDLAI